MRAYGRLLRLAALALGLVSQGCILGPPPDLKDSERTRPFLYFRQVQPSPAEPIQIELPASGDPSPSMVGISIPFQSQDLGERVGAQLHLYGPDGYLDHLTGTLVPAADLGVLKTATLTWQPARRPPGCYLLRAILAHESSFNDEIIDGFVKQQHQDDSDTIYWVVDMYSTQQDTNELSDCPRVGVVGDVD